MQFLSVSILSDVSKPPDVYDDLESLYWVLLYVAISCFDFNGILPSSLFDEVKEGVIDGIGRVYGGGEKKKKWLGHAGLSFLCNELQNVLTAYRNFFHEYSGLVSSAEENDADKEELEAFKANFQDHIHVLMNFFDSVLNQSSDWDDSEAHDAPPRPKGTRADELVIWRATEAAAGLGRWPGAYGYVPPATTCTNELPKQPTGDLIAISKESESAGAAVEELVKVLLKAPETFEAVPASEVAPKPKRRRLVVEKSDRILRSRTEK